MAITKWPSAPLGSWASGAKFFHYEPGGASTAKDVYPTYADAVAVPPTNALPQPVVLNSVGWPQNSMGDAVEAVFLDGDYYATLKDSTEATTYFATDNFTGDLGETDVNTFPLNYVAGFGLSLDTDTDHDVLIAAGEARDAADSEDMVLSAGITKQIDAAWAVGDDAGGLDTGSVANSTVYYLWLIKRTDTGVVDVLFSTSSSSPTMPTNYDKKRLIGRLTTDGSANIAANTIVQAFPALKQDPTGVLNLTTSGDLGLGEFPNLALGAGFRHLELAGSEGGAVVVRDVDDNVGGRLFSSDSSNAVILGSITNHPLNFRTNNTYRASIDTSGNFMTAKSSASSTTVGAELRATGVVLGVTGAAACAFFNRRTDDGDLIQLAQADVQEGAISVSGTTVTYGTFCGVHWSQLADNSTPDILPGTIIDSIDDMCAWPGEGNDQLARCKVSDTEASKAVYGVFMRWDANDDGTNPTGDMLVASLGAWMIRIGAGVTVQRGDLLESAGDGTARVQSDDVMRSSTIAKVTANVVRATYDDGSYLVPCTLHCG